MVTNHTNIIFAFMVGNNKIAKNLLLRAFTLGMVYIICRENLV